MQNYLPPIILFFVTIIVESVVAIVGKHKKTQPVIRILVAFIVLICAVLVLLVWNLYVKNSEFIDTQRQLYQTRIDLENFKEEKNACEDHLDVLGAHAEGKSELLKNVDDFKKDWDTSDFYMKSSDTFCPKNKGNNNFQRMTYKQTTPLAATNLSLKFQMIDEKEGGKNYPQRVVLGMKLNDVPFSEVDFPTRDSQVINLREATDSGKFIPITDGVTFRPPIKDNSIINVEFETKHMYGQNVAENLTINYLSPEDGEKTQNASGLINVEDTQPEGLRANPFLGSYRFGCIKIIGWSAY